MNKKPFRYFIPEWDDRVDPNYNFLMDEHSPNRDPYQDDVYCHEIFDPPPYDGILISKVVIEQNRSKKLRIQKIGVHKHVRAPQGMPIMGDCGAFGYVQEYEPPFETNEIVQYYQDFQFDYGVSIDHLMIPGLMQKKVYWAGKRGDWQEINEKEFQTLIGQGSQLVAKRNSKEVRQASLLADEIFVCEENELDEQEQLRRYNLTIKNAEDFLKAHRDSEFTFTPIGAVQGWSPESYAEAFRQYQEMGYQYIALGTLVPKKTNEILEILEEIAPMRQRDIELHLFGIARFENLSEFKKLGVTSMDSASSLRQAWTSSTSNYYSPRVGDKAYTAIRIPQVDEALSKKLNLPIVKLREIEQKALKSLRNYEIGLVDLSTVLSDVLDYHSLTKGQAKLYDQYERTLRDQPWKECECRICKEVGIEIIIFRGNNRNRRRGFHNTFISKKLREII